MGCFGEDQAEYQLRERLPIGMLGVIEPSREVRLIGWRLSDDADCPAYFRNVSRKDGVAVANGRAIGKSIVRCSSKTGQAPYGQSILKTPFEPPPTAPSTSTASSATRPLGWTVRPRTRCTCAASPPPWACGPSSTTSKSSAAGGCAWSGSSLRPSATTLMTLVSRQLTN